MRKIGRRSSRPARPCPLRLEWLEDRRLLSHGVGNGPPATLVAHADGPQAGEHRNTDNGQDHRMEQQHDQAGNNGLGSQVSQLTHEGVHGQDLADRIHQLQGKDHIPPSTSDHGGTGKTGTPTPVGGTTNSGSGGQSNGSRGTGTPRGRSNQDLTDQGQSNQDQANQVPPGQVRSPRSTDSGGQTGDNGSSGVPVTASTGTVGDDSTANPVQVTSQTTTPGTQSGSGTVQAPADSASPLRARSSSPSAASSLANAEGSTSGQAHIPLSAEEIALEERTNGGGSAVATRSEAAVAIALTQVLLQYQGRASFLLGGGSSAADDLVADNLPAPVTQAAAPTQGVALVSASSGSAAAPRTDSPDEVLVTPEQQAAKMASAPERPAAAEQNQPVRQSTERKIEAPQKTESGAHDEVQASQAQAEGAGLVVEPVGEGVSGIGQGMTGLLEHIESWVGESTPTRVAAFLSPVLTAAMGAFVYGAVRRRRKKAAAAAAVTGPLGPDTDTWLPGDSDLPSVDPS